MNSILAIDAAWTEKEPSAVVLLQQTGSQWYCRALAPSYKQFLSLPGGGQVDWAETPTGQKPAMGDLLVAAQQLLGQQQVNLITVDMPVSIVPITGYREAERAIARGFSKYGCAAHSPSITRPGKIGRAYTDNLEQQGYELGTTSTHAGTIQRLLEVYPHPALLRLMSADYRLEYKASKTSRYWPELSIIERKQKLLSIYKNILRELAQYIHDINLALPAELVEQPFSSFKRYEDTIDALVCGWVGLQYLQGNAQAYGDETGAIWVPG